MPHRTNWRRCGLLGTSDFRVFGTIKTKIFSQMNNGNIWKYGFVFLKSLILVSCHHIINSYWAPFAEGDVLVWQFQEYSKIIPCVLKCS